MTNLTVINNCILFQFEDELMDSQGVKQFKNITDWGLSMVNNYDSSVKCPRWVKVLAIGPKVKDVTVGMRILIEALKWTEGVKYNDQMYWMTNEAQVLLIDTDSE